MNFTMVVGVAVMAIGASCGGHGAGHGGGDGGLPSARPGGLDVTGNALFVALGANGSIAVVDIDAWNVAGTLHLSDTYFPHHLSLSPDGTRIAVGAPASDLSGGHGDGGHEAGDGALYVLDSRTGDVVAQALAGGTAHNLAFLPNVDVVVFALMEHGMIHFADPRNLSIKGTANVGGMPLEATPTAAGDKILVANSGDGTVSVVNVASMAVEKTLTVGANPIGAWLGAGGRAYVTSESDQKLSVIDLTSLTLAKTVDLPGTPGQAITTTNGTVVWVAMEDTGKIIVLAAADLSVLDEITVGLGTRPHGLALSPDGASVYVTDEATGQVIEFDAATLIPKRSLNVGGAPNGVLYRPALPGGGG